MNTSKFLILIEKLYYRITEWFLAGNAPQVKAFCHKHAQNSQPLMKKWDLSLFEETMRFEKELKQNARENLKEQEWALGIGGHYPLLYFLVRYLKPVQVIETGVAVGFTSQAILQAMSQNNQGTLFSSDLPYLRDKNKNVAIGKLVTESVKDRWRLYTAGDRLNLQEILPQIDKLDLFHYDSDKRVLARRFVWDKIHPLLHEKSVLLMDDIGDNAFFMRVLEKEKRPWMVLEFQGKFVGLIGLDLTGHLS